jgi:hypothetical protein
MHDEFGGKILDIGSGTAVFVAIIGAVGWVTSEIVRRSDPRRLEQLATVIDHVSEESAQSVELQKEIDRLALRIAVKRRRPNYSMLHVFGLLIGCTTLYLLFSVVLGIILSILDPTKTAPPLPWQFWVGYIVTCIAILARRTLRSVWFDSEYQRLSGEAKPNFSWRLLLSA